MANITRKFLEDKLQSHNDFIGVRLDEDTVQLLERKLRDQKMDIRIFFFVAVDSDGHQVLVIPDERVSATTFLSQKAIWKKLGRIQVKEVEQIRTTFFEGSPESGVVDDTVADPSSEFCWQVSTLIQQKKPHP